MKLTYFTGAFFALLLLSGCASSNRMFSRSPLGGESQKSASIAQQSFDSQDVNLWPLIYSNSKFTSVLWPFFDVDANGMAIRPFYNRDGDEYSILFPFAAWNPVNGDGWVLPAYWDAQSGVRGFFPLYMHTRHVDFFTMLYLTRDHNSNVDGGGLLPVSYFCRDWGYFANFWYGDDFDSWGVFPVVWSFPHTTIAAPACWTFDKNGEVDGGGLFPVSYFCRDWGYFANFWYGTDFEFWGVFPIVWSYPQTKVVAPAYWTHDEEGNFDGCGFIPLFAYANDQQRDSAFFNFLGIGGHYSRDADQTSFWSLPLLTYYSSDGEEDYIFISAGYMSFREENKRVDGFFPLAIRDESETSVNWTALWPIFNIQHNKEDNALERFHIWPLYGYNSSYLNLIDVDDQSCSAFTPLVFYRSWVNSKPEWKVPSSIINSRRAELKTADDFDYLDENITSDDTTAGFWGYAETANVSIGTMPVAICADGQEQMVTIEECVVNPAEKKEWSDVGFPYLPMFYRKQTFGDEYRWHGPGSFWLSLMNGYKVADKEEVKVLQFLYRYRRQGDLERTIFFPGCSFVKQGENTRFSFWYRVWEYQVKDGDVSGHFLFFPF